MEGKGWTQDDLAGVLGRTRQHVNRLLQGKTGITPETAHELAKAFGTSAELWANLQMSYELALAANERKEIAQRAAVFSKLPLREVIKRGWIKDSKNIDELEQSVCRFLDIDDISQEPTVRVAARKGTSYEVDTAAQKAWYRRCWQLAEVAPAATYKKSHLETGIQELLKLAAYPEDARRIPKQLADMGIRFVINQHLTGTKIDAVAFWLDAQTPAVAVSLRHGRIDNLWFNLLHELVHIKYDHAASIDVDMESMVGDDLPEIEKIANREAANYLVPADDLQSFVDRAGGYFYQPRVVQFAQAHRVHPGIAVGQLHHHPNGLEPKQLRKLLVSIREHVIGQAVTDGWGNTPNLEEV
jgi:HTH-type transcriptional regulator / antitoxin HigA